MTNDTETTPLSDDDRHQLETLFRTAATLAEGRIVETVGRPFLADLMADPQGEVVVQIAIKGQMARIGVRWPHHGAGLVTIADLMPGTSGRLAS